MDLASLCLRHSQFFPWQSLAWSQPSLARSPRSGHYYGCLLTITGRIAGVVLGMLYNLLLQLKKWKPERLRYLPNGTCWKTAKSELDSGQLDSRAGAVKRHVLCWSRFFLPSSPTPSFSHALASGPANQLYHLSCHLDQQDLGVVMSLFLCLCLCSFFC